jgi:hypothetical protein
MPIINPSGLFSGQRLRRCSDGARLYWPYFFLASDGFARIEIDYHALIARVFVGFQNVPSEEEFSGLIREYWHAYLLFVYQVEGVLWGQWDTNDKYLPRHKSRADQKSPKPPQAAYDEWLAARKSQETNGLRRLSEILQKTSALFGNLPKPLGGVGGVPTPTPTPIPEGGCKGETNELPKLPAYDPSELTAWLVINYPAHRQRGPWQSALAERIGQDYAAQRDPAQTETLIRKGLVAFKRSQQWRDGKIENLAKWLEEGLFVSPPPEHEGRPELEQVIPASHRDWKPDPR